MFTIAYIVFKNRTAKVGKDSTNQNILLRISRRRVEERIKAASKNIFSQKG
jgi:hypothetical protein